MKLKFVLISFAIIALFNSCSRSDDDTDTSVCDLLDCVTGVYFQVKIIDQLTSNSLLTASDSLYHIDNMSITSFVDGQQIEGWVHWHEGSNALTCGSNVSPDMILLTLNEGETDTLRFDNEFIESDCPHCDWYRLYNVSINGGEMMPVFENTVTLFK